MKPYKKPSVITLPKGKSETALIQEGVRMAIAVVDRHRLAEHVLLTEREGPEYQRSQLKVGLDALSMELFRLVDSLGKRKGKR